MVSAKAIQALVISLFIVIVLVGLVFVLSRQLAPLLEEMERSTTARAPAVTTSTTSAPLVPATLTAMNQVLAATAAPVTVSTTPTPTTGSTVATVRMGIVNSDVINVRSYPDLAGEVVAQARQGDRLEILTTSIDGKWLQVCCPLGTNEGDRQSWVAAEFVTIQQEVTGAAGITQSNTVSATPVRLVGTPAAPPSTTDGAVTGTVNSSGVNLRSGPGTMYAVVGQAQEQSAVELTGRDAANLWWQICCPPGAPALSWVSAEFIDIVMPKEQVLPLVPVVTSVATPIASPATSAP